jgi:PAS domain-containing protein
VVASIHHAIDAGAESWSAEYRFQRKDGSYASVQDRGFILRDVAGKAVRMVGGMRDWSSVGMCPAAAKSSAPISPG